MQVHSVQTGSVNPEYYVVNGEILVNQGFRLQIKVFFVDLPISYANCASRSL